MPPEDLRAPWRRPSADAKRHYRQESEANRFAIELLAPRRIFRPFLRGIPDLTYALRLADQLELSREACARRYAELHSQPMALLFSQNGAVRYVDKSKEFPHRNCRPRDPLPALPSPTVEDALSAHEEADPRRLARSTPVARL